MRTLEQKETKRVKHKQWYQANREKILARVKDYYQANKENHRIVARKYAQSHKEQIALYSIAWLQKLKIEVLEYYGGGKLVCVKCGYSDIRALSIDHVNGDGNTHRKLLKTNIYYWLKMNKFPEGYQTLCFNCQMLKKTEKKEYGKHD